MRIALMNLAIHVQDDADLVRPAILLRHALLDKNLIPSTYFLTPF